MNNRPTLLDLFCGAGGAGTGYHRAGFDVVGVDNKPQPRYPFQFHQADALEYLAEHGREFDVIHASPPCQVHTRAQKIQNNGHIDLVGPVRQLMRATKRHYIVENVPGAPLIEPVLLVGTMFGLRTNRPRLFECSFPVPFQLMPPVMAQAKMGRPARFDGDFIQVVGNFSGVDYARAAMGIDWMTRDELAQAIPPAYTEWLGKQILDLMQ